MRTVVSSSLCGAHRSAPISPYHRQNFLRQAVATAGWCTQRRHQTRVPNKGYRQQPAIPDRLKDTMATFGTDMQSLHSDADPPYVPEHQRQHMLQDVLSSSQNLKSVSKLDRLRTALDEIRSEPPAHPKWKEVYLFLRTTEMCTEVVANESDVFPKGQKLWIELALCEEKRVPLLMKLPNGMPVLPAFTMEAYMDVHFSHTNVYDSCWFPVPRSGTQWEEFCKLPFPVCVTGEIQHFGMLATAALGGTQLGILVNPGQRTSKFLTYPELVTLTRLKQRREKGHSSTPSQTTPSDSTGGAPTATKTSAAELDDLFDASMMVTFDTSKMAPIRLHPDDLAACTAGRPPVPPIAQLELHLLLHPYREIESVYIRTVDRPRWRTMLGATQKMTQIDVVCSPGTKPAEDFFPRLQRWSFMKEFNSDVHVELTNTTPAAQEPANVFMCVYHGATDGELLRSMATFKGRTLAAELGFNEPITDAAGNKPYERFASYF